MPCRRAGCGVFGKSFDVRVVDLPVKVGLIKVGLNSYSAALQRLGMKACPGWCLIFLFPGGEDEGFRANKGGLNDL